MTSKYNSNAANAAVKSAISALRDGEKALLAACIQAVGMAAEHGQFTQLTRLYQEIPLADAPKVRQWIKNFTSTYGAVKEAENGSEVAVSFIGFDANKREFKKRKGDKANETARNYLALSQEALEAISFAAPKTDRDSDAAKEFSEQAEMVRFIERMAKLPTSESLLKGMANLLDAKHRFNPLAVRAENVAKLTKQAQNVADKLNKARALQGSSNSATFIPEEEKTEEKSETREPAEA